MTRSPIFIGGMFKSGTTLLRAMLAQHSAIASGLETYWFDFDWSNRHSASMQVNIKRLAGYFDLDAQALNEMAVAAPNPEQFLDRLMSTVADREHKSRWAEKTPGNIAHLDRIWAAWPQAQVIHIIRDPRDVFASLVEAGKWDSAEEFAERWCATVGRGASLLEICKPGPDRYLEIHYEQLISSPEETTHRLLNFLGERWEAQVAAFSGRSEDFDKVLQATGKASTTLERLKEPLTQQRIGIWRRVLRDEQLAAIEKAIAMRGYSSLYERIIRGTPAAVTHV